MHKFMYECINVNYVSLKVFEVEVAVKWNTKQDLLNLKTWTICTLRKWDVKQTCFLKVVFHLKVIFHDSVPKTEF